MRWLRFRRPSAATRGALVEPHRQRERWQNPASDEQWPCARVGGTAVPPNRRDGFSEEFPVRMQSLRPKKAQTSQNSTLLRMQRANIIYCSEIDATCIMHKSQIFVQILSQTQRSSRRPVTFATFSHFSRIPSRSRQLLASAPSPHTIVWHEASTRGRRP